MTYTFRRAVRAHVSLIIGLSGGTGSGKTYSAMRLASGMCGDRPFAVIDTENGRASHYADMFTFDVLDLRPPFSPEAYAQAILVADQAQYPVILVDSMSHEWAGDGGVLDLQEHELDRMAGQDYKKREACRMAAWIKPKLAHKHMMQKLLQVKAHLILCFRADEKIEMARVDGKLEIRAKQSLVGKDGWVPVCEKNVPFEATCSFLLLASDPGKPHPIKLQEQHKALIDLSKPIEENVGRRLAEWARGTATREDGPQSRIGDSHQLRQDAPATISSDDPAEPWRAKIRTAHDSKAVNAVYYGCPDHLRQDLYNVYTDKLRQLKGA